MFRSLTLIVENPATKRQSEYTFHNSCKVGSAPDCDLQLHSEYVESHHGLFEFLPGVGWRYNDFDAVHTQTVIHVVGLAQPSTCSHEQPVLVRDGDVLLFSGVLRITIAQGAASGEFRNG